MTFWVSKYHHGDRSGLGFVKEKKPESFPLTNQRGSTKSYAQVLKSPIKKEKWKENDLSFHDKDRTHEEPKRQVINRNQKIFLIHFYLVITLVINPWNARLMKKFISTRRMQLKSWRYGIITSLDFSKVLI